MPRRFRETPRHDPSRRFLRLPTLSRRWDDRRRPSRGGSLSFDPRPMAVDADRDRRDRGAWRVLRRVDVGAVFAGVLGLGTLVLVLVLVYRGTRVEVTQTGLEDDAVFNALSVAAVDVSIELPSPDDAASAVLRFDGEVVEDPTVEGRVIRWRPPEGLEEGEHTLSLSVARVLLKDARFDWDFTLDVTPPAVEAPVVSEAVAIDQSATVSGTVERGASVVAGGRDVDVEDDGSFTLSFPRPPAGPVVLEAIDEAGNRATTSVVVPVTLPGMRAVHVTAAAWGSEGLRNRVLQMVDEGRIDTVVLDLKDEAGVVGFDTTVERAAEIGAAVQYYDLDAAVATLQEHGARVVGRIVAFQDPIYAQTAWAAGQGDQVIQNPDGQPYDAPGRFTNFAHPTVQRYNLDIALDAIDRGVRDILWDDVRQPGDDPSAVLVPGVTGSRSDAVVGFLADVHGELRRRGAYQGVAIEGLSVDRGDLFAQDVAQMARRADYLVPELHPAFWSTGYFDVPSPVHQPAELVAGALRSYQALVQNSGTVLSPSLQDFSARGVTYGPDEVRAQIDAAAATGSSRFVLWDPSVTYTAEALLPQG